MHPINKPIPFTLDKDHVCIPVERKGKKLYLNGNIQIANKNTQWTNLPDTFELINNDGEVVPKTGRRIISVETIDPFHLITEI